MIQYMGYTEKQLIEIIDYWEQRNKEVSTLKTRAEAIALLRSNGVFGLIDTGQAAKWVDFFIAAGMLEVKKEEENHIEAAILDAMRNACNIKDFFVFIEH